MDLKTKQTIVTKLSKEYKKASKKEKGVILTELIRLTTYNIICQIYLEDSTSSKS